MINWIRGKLGLSHDHYVNAKKLFEYWDFGVNRPKCVICNKELK